MCKICGELAGDFGDNRTLKNYYADGDVHTAEELLDAGVEAWLLYEPGSQGDKDCKAWLKRKGII